MTNIHIILRDVTYIFIFPHNTRRCIGAVRIIFRRIHNVVCGIYIYTRVRISLAAKIIKARAHSRLEERLYTLALSCVVQRGIYEYTPARALTRHSRLTRTNFRRERAKDNKKKRAHSTSPCIHAERRYRYIRISRARATCKLNFSSASSSPRDFVCMYVMMVFFLRACCCLERWLNEEGFFVIEYFSELFHTADI